MIAVFGVADAIRPESREAVRRLPEAGAEVVMLIGDAKAVADAVAADLLPTDKAKIVE
ncbi:MAG: Lead, cadmium, zinc and mercury transporting ATPase [Hydrogenibacillus schlegelii]|uniref:Lead, cadmium, zinc and mercury transporting ATPase n=1 Tax=Hydrogenibacillus schlegelii TaxID=1484 RepID=A0A2T5G6R3_HYDSH|nr:HAD family hydrolase [Hydrogenibacillus schlegelii]PTQ50814.1 MAG: Lead, cadmium, zinc and mercury transporting ATPase [Hydrogenibacillus schlegelii]PTQ51886.1 MAG: Lead, cadmium, zinc and mercury transporting ATPase [Hydrogenibacillus schlegelii]